MDSRSRMEIVVELMRNLGLSLQNKNDRCLLHAALEDAEQRGYERGNLNNATLAEADLNGYKRAMTEWVEDHRQEVS